MLQKRANGRTLCYLTFIILALASAAPVSAQDRPPARVVGFPVSLGGGATRLDQETTAMLGHRITVRLEAWPTCYEPAATAPAATAASQPASSAGNKPSQAVDQKNASDGSEPSWIPGISHAQILKLVPYLDSRPLKGVYPETVDPESHTLTYHLRRTEASKEAWNDLLSNPGFKPKAMTFSVGLEDKQQFPTCVSTSLVVIPVKRFIGAISLFLVVLYIFFRMAAGTALLRDPGASQGYMPGFSVLWRRPSADTKLGPYSLSRTQMAFWLFVVVASFLLIWMITGDTDTITESVLILIGISAGTALGATAIDSSKKETSDEVAPKEASRGFLNDILSDGTGVSFHRFQIAVWTIVLGFVFSRNVLNHLAMPEFGTNLLTLMGISSGTYLGLKLPEQGPEGHQNKGQAQKATTGSRGDQTAQAQPGNDQ